jgi:hypothetical protein
VTGPLWERLPDGWMPGQVKHAATVTLGKMLQSEDSGGDVAAPYMRAANVQPDGVLALDDVNKMWFSKVELEQLSIQAGDVVVVEGGQGGFGRAAYVEEDLIGWGFQNSINRLRPIGDFDGRFIAFYLIALRASGFIRAYANVVSMPHLTAEKLARIPIPLPPLGEQRAIADYLDCETARIDTLIEEQQRLIEMLVSRKSAVADAVITQGLDADSRLVDSGVDWIGPIPEGWRIRPLWSMFRRIKDVDHPEEQMLSVFRDYGVVAKDSRDNINKTAENRSIYQLVHPGWLVTNRMKAWQGERECPDDLARGGIAVLPMLGRCEDHSRVFARGSARDPVDLRPRRRARPPRHRAQGRARGVPEAVHQRGARVCGCG